VGFRWGQLLWDTLGKERVVENVADVEVPRPAEHGHEMRGDLGRAALPVTSHAVALGGWTVWISHANPRIVRRCGGYDLPQVLTPAGPAR
jgi:hypothetical protein